METTVLVPFKGFKCLRGEVLFSSEGPKRVENVDAAKHKVRDDKLQTLNRTSTGRRLPQSQV